MRGFHLVLINVPSPQPISQVLLIDVSTRLSPGDKWMVKQEHEMQGKSVPKERANADKWFACRLSTRVINGNILVPRITAPCH